MKQGVVRAAFVGAMVVAMVVGVCGVCAGAVSYQVVDLGPGIARAINSSGQAVGNDAPSFNVGAGHAVLWENGSTVAQVLPTLPDPYNNWADAVSINDQGQVAGESVRAFTYQGQAVLWENKTANPTPLGFLSGHDTSLAYGMNNAGQVVGASRVYTQQNSSPFLWESGAMRNLGVIDAFDGGAANAINDAGMVIGSCWTNQGAERACLWSDGLITYLGEPAGHTRSGTCDVNNLGDVVGNSGPSGKAYACWWHRGVATNLQLDAPSGYQSGYSNAYAINNLGQVVGHLCNTLLVQGQQFKGRAYLWQNHSMQLLPLPDGYSYATALGINDRGQIVGFVGDGYTQSRAVLWNPVPEPSGMLALGSGLIGLGGVFFKRRRR